MASLGEPSDEWDDEWEDMDVEPKIGVPQNGWFSFKRGDFQVNPPFIFWDVFLDVEPKIVFFSPKMDGLFHGKPY